MATSNPLSKRIILGLLTRASKVLPQNRAVDYILALIQFVHSNRRLPRTVGGTLNDAFFYIKTSPEMLDALRVYVSDKALVKDYVRARLSDAYNVDTLGLLTTYEEACDYNYPENCVIKPTHMSGQLIFRRNGSPVDFKSIHKWFETNYYLDAREVNYRYLRPRVLVEPFIFNQDAVEDYKIFCMHGEPLIIQVDHDRYTGHTQSMYTADWEKLPFAISCPVGKTSPRPENLPQLLETARNLSADFNLIRIDLYTNGREILLGEITNCHQGADGYFVPPEGEQIMSKILFGDAGFSPAGLKEKPKNRL